MDERRDRGAEAGAEGTCADIDDVLDRARVLEHEYDDCDPAAARERIALMLDGSRPRPEVGRPAAAPARAASEHEQARHELDLASTLVVNAPEAAPSLAMIADEQPVAPEGALVFACLLHLSGREDAAQFWWRFAAGGGSHTAAYCLYLHHRRQAEFRDADYWRAQAARLADRAARPRPDGSDPVPDPPDEAGPGDGTRPAPGSGDGAGTGALQRGLLPGHVVDELISQCHQGLAPHLPSAVEAALGRLAVVEDEEFGEIPRPSPVLARRLADPR